MTVYSFLMFWIRVGARVFYRVRVLGRADIPSRGPFILAANHASNLDSPIIAGFAFPREIHYMAKEDLFSKVILSWLLPRLHAFPVDRDGSVRKALQDSLDVLRAGNCLGIFPEGRRGAGGRHAARQGGAWLAIQAQVPVVPCAIAGSAGARLFRSRISVIYGKPVFPPSGVHATKEELAKLTQTIMGAIDALYGEISGNS